MKKISILLVSFLFVFSACSSDDNTDAPDDSIDITGSWDVTELEGEGEATGDFNGLPVTVPFTVLGKDFDAQVVFTQDPNAILPGGSLVIEVTASFLGQVFTEEELVNFSEVFPPASSWSIEGNILTYESEGQIQTAEILSLTQNKMVLLLEQSNAVMEFEGNGIIEVTLER